MHLAAGEPRTPVDVGGDTAVPQAEEDVAARVSDPNCLQPPPPRGPRPRSVTPKALAHRPIDVPSSVEGGCTTVTPLTEGTYSAPSLAGSSPSARSSVTATERCSLRAGAQGIPWSSLKFGHRIQPYSRLVYGARDAGVLSCFLELARVADVSGESVKLLLRTLRFLRSCHYAEEDICLMLAHASIYFPDTYAVAGHNMSSNEAGNVLATLIFLAHCWVQDETCPLRIWHQHLFKQYCTLATLNSAVLRLMELRGYILRVGSAEVEHRMEKLVAASDAAVRGCTPVPRVLPARSVYFGAQGQGSTFLRRGLETILDTCVSRTRSDNE